MSYYFIFWEVCNYVLYAISDYGNLCLSFYLASLKRFIGIFIIFFTKNEFLALFYFLLIFYFIYFYPNFAFFSHLFLFSCHFYVKLLCRTCIETFVSSKSFHNHIFSPMHGFSYFLNILTYLVQNIFWCYLSFLTSHPMLELFMVDLYKI